MRLFKKIGLMVLLLVFFVVLPKAYAATSPTLGAAGSYSVLGGETVTNAGTTTMPGDLGVSPGSAVTGGPTVGPPGSIHAADANAADAQLANTAAFGALSAGDNLTCTGLISDELGGRTLEPGVYCTESGQFQLTSGVLHLSAGTYIFQTRTGLTTAAGGTIEGGDPCNVWWKIGSSAVIGSGSKLIGNILALTSISLASGATLNGRAFAQTGSVTLDSNTITGSACLTASTVTPTPIIDRPGDNRSDNLGCSVNDCSGNKVAGTTGTGQVLGASTLASTGDGSLKLGVLLMIFGITLTLTSAYAFKKSSS